MKKGIKVAYITGVCGIVGSIIVAITNLVADETQTISIDEINIENDMHGATIQGDKIFIDSTINYNNEDKEKNLHDATIYINDLSDNIDGSSEMTFFDEQEASIDKNKKYVYSGYTGILNISNNNTDKEIILCDFHFIAENITVNTSPDLRSMVYRLEDEDEHLFDVCLINDGWGEATDILLSFDDICGIGDIDCFLAEEKNEKDTVSYLNDLFPESELSINIPVLEEGTSNTVGCFSLKNMNEEKFQEILSLYGDFYWSIDVYAQCKENNYSKELVGNIILVVSENKIVDYGGYGYDAPYHYAILVDTSNRNFEFSTKINESIPEGKTLELPISFFPDKSCSLTYYIELEVYDGNENYKIVSDKKDLNFDICSYFDSSFCDAKCIGEHMNDASGYYEPEFVTFPYAIFDKEKSKFLYNYDIIYNDEELKRE